MFLTLKGEKASFCPSSLNLFAKESIGSSFPPNASQTAVNCFDFSAANKVPRDSFNSLSESTGHVGITTAFDSEIKPVNSWGSEDLKSIN